MMTTPNSGKDSLCSKQTVYSFLRMNLLLIATILSVILGVIIGVLCRGLNPTSDTVHLVAFPGLVFMRIFKMLLLPLVSTSIITGLSKLRGKTGGKVGILTMMYYLSTTLMAIFLGIVLAITIRPGETTVAEPRVTRSDGRPLPSALDTLFDLIRNMFPDNIIQAAFQHSAGTYIEVKDAERNYTTPSSNQSGDADSKGGNHWKRTIAYRDGMNVTGILVFCSIFSIMLNKLGPKSRLMVEFFEVFNEIIMKMTKLAMWYCPIGILSIVLSKILAVPDLWSAVQQLAMYMVTGLTGLVIHSLVILPVIYVILTRQNPYRVSLGAMQALLTGMATSSSSATLPVTIRCCEDVLKFDRSVSRFVLPIGATINMDGLAIVQALTPIFLAQMTNTQLMFGDIVTIGLSATLASIGAAGVPGTGFITMLAVVAAVGLPVEEAYIVLTVDWFMMRMVTMVNIYGDCLAVGVLSHYFSQPRSDHELLQSRSEEERLQYASPSESPPGCEDTACLADGADCERGQPS